MPHTESAQKVRITEILAGEFEEVSVDGNRYFRLPWGSVSRVRVMGLVIDSHVREGGSFAVLEIHDGTASTQVRAWDEDVSLLIDPDTGKLYDRGSLLDIIAKVRSYRDNFYLSPIMVLKVRDPNALLLRELEIIRRELRLRINPKKREDDDLRAIIRALKELGPLKVDELADLLGKDPDKIRKKLKELVALGLIYGSNDKYSYVGQR
mgnify:CR=1 FL=1